MLNCHSSLDEIVDMIESERDRLLEAIDTVEDKLESSFGSSTRAMYRAAEFESRLNEYEAQLKVLENTLELLKECSTNEAGLRIIKSMNLELLS